MEKRRKKSWIDNRTVYLLLVLALLIIAAFGLIKTTYYIGYTVLNAGSGTITEIIIDRQECTYAWGGYYGMAIMVFNYSGSLSDIPKPCTDDAVVQKHLLFPCMGEDENEVYASTKQSDEIFWDSVVAASPEDVDNYLNYTGTEQDSAKNVFTENISINLGERTIWAPGTYTRQYGNSNPTTPYNLVILKDVVGTLIFATKTARMGTKGFHEGEDSNYQLILPVKNNTSPMYYFMVDPYEVCPAGLGYGIIGDGYVTGYATNNNTNLPIGNVSIYLYTAMNNTDENGFYNFTVPFGYQYVAGIKEGYEPHIGAVNISIGKSYEYNFSMVPLKPYLENGTVHGFVFDNITMLPLANVTVSAGGVIRITNETGEYTLVILEGTHNIVAKRDGYETYTENITIIANNITQHNITMAVEVTKFLNGTVQGIVLDNITMLPLANVTVSAGGVIRITNETGEYTLVILEGTHNIVATKTRYDNYIGEINISANNITIHNISMGIFEYNITEDNGSIAGIVMDANNILLENATVSVAGQTATTNSIGEYFLNIPSGIHNLVAIKSGYDNYIAEVRIGPGNTTFHNITMNITDVEIVPGTGTGAGTSDGTGTGTGIGPGIGPARIERPSPVKVVEKFAEHQLPIDKIVKKLRIGSFLNVPISIINFRTTEVNVRMTIEGEVIPLIELEKTSMTLGPDSTGEFIVTLLGRGEPGVYEGKLVISGDIEAEIPIIIMLYKKDKLPIEGLLIELKVLDDTVYTGNKLRYRVDIQNLLREEEYDIKLIHKITNERTGKQYLIDTDEVIVQTSFSLLKSFTIPDDFELGEHILSVEAEYLEFSSKHTAVFNILRPFYKYSIFGIIPLWLLLLIIAVTALGIFLFFWYKKKKAEKERYKIEMNITDLPKEGPRSAFIGNIPNTSIKTYFDLDKFQIHTLIAGTSGSGKSVGAEVLVEEALSRDVSVIVFDPTANWTGFLRKCKDKKLLDLYPKFGMKKAQARAFNGNVHRVNDGREIIDFKKYAKPGEINIFVTNKLRTEDTELFVANTIREVFKANLPESAQLKYLLVYDGIHTLLPKFGGSGKVFIHVERATREFRKWGVGLILISQVLSDFPSEVLGNINTEIQMRTRDEGDLNRIKEEYGEDILKSVVKAAIGTGVIENAAYNKGKPYFVTFRPVLHSLERLSDKELEDYNKYNKTIADIEYELEQLKEEGIDTFDLELELKLAKDKVKSGNFNMVDIYIEGLKPRVDKQWDKLGKKPKERKIRLANIEELKKELNSSEDNKASTNVEGPEKELKDSSKKKDEADDDDDDDEKKEEIKNKEGGLEENREERLEEGKKEKEAVENNDKKEKENEKEQVKETTEEQIRELINKAGKHIEAKEKYEANTYYAKIMQAYKGLPKELKKKFLKDCLEIRNKLTKLS
ncbi:MAG: carboxypeptidase regulatory-like domain-containing protein [Nanoarchaeota archaeon]|nr:carboxypeptidase regulatory-like domain-containing protein [Nanoarchaeota archaeon]